MITQEKIYSIASQLPYGAGKVVAEKAKVSEAFVSLFLNGHIKNLESDSCLKVIKECCEYIKRDRVKRDDVDAMLKEV